MVNKEKAYMEYQTIEKHVCEIPYRLLLLYKDYFLENTKKVC